MRYELIDPKPLFESGSNAYLNGLELDACPFRPFSAGEEVWLEGWRDAYNSHLVENNNILDEELSDDQFYLRYGWIPIVENVQDIIEAVYQGRKVDLNKPTRGDSKKFKVYVNSGKKNKDGEIVAKKVEFGDVKGGLRIRKGNAKARKSFAARHNCKEKLKKGDKTTAGYWSCRAPTSKTGGVW